MASFLWAIHKVLGLINSVTLRKESEQKEYGFTELTCTGLRIITGNIKGDGKKCLHPLHATNVFFYGIGIRALYYLCHSLLLVLSAEIQGDRSFTWYGAE